MNDHSKQGRGTKNQNMHRSYRIQLHRISFCVKQKLDEFSLSFLCGHMQNCRSKLFEMRYLVATHRTLVALTAVLTFKFAERSMKKINVSFSQERLSIPSSAARCNAALSSICRNTNSRKYTQEELLRFHQNIYPSTTHLTVIVSSISSQCFSKIENKA